MTPVVLVVFGAAAVAGVVAGAVAWFLPNFDPAAPHATPTFIADQAAKAAEAQPRRRAYLRSRLDPTSLTGLALTVGLALLALGAAAVGVMFVMIQRDTGLAHYDLSAARWGGDNATNASTRILRDVSLLGGTPVMIAVAVATAIVQYRRTRTAAVFGFLTLVVAGQVILTNLTKLLVGRDRPSIHQLTGFSGSSFPSGHAATAAATFAAVALLIGRGRSRPTKALLATGAAAIATGVAVTRVLLGVHWLTDVVAGLALGWAWFAVCSIAFGGRVLRFGRPVEIADHAVDIQIARSALDDLSPAPSAR